MILEILFPVALVLMTCTISGSVLFEHFQNRVERRAEKGRQHEIERMKVDSLPAQLENDSLRLAIQKMDKELNAKTLYAMGTLSEEAQKIIAEGIASAIQRMVITAAEDAQARAASSPYYPTAYRGGF